MVRTSSYATIGRIPYQVVHTNIGGAMTISAGTFTAPKAGIYTFAFKSNANAIIATDYSGFAQTRLLVNGNMVGRGQATSYEPNGGTGNGLTIVIHATLQLKVGDAVWVNLDGGSLYDSAMMHTHFTGSLLEEDLGIA